MKDIEALLTSYRLPFTESKSKPGLWYREVADTTEFVDVRDGVSVYMANKHEPGQDLKNIKDHVQGMLDSEQTTLPEERPDVDSTPVMASEKHPDEKFIRWLEEEVKPKIKLIEEHMKCNSYKQQIFSAAVTPYHYFEEDETLTDKQADYLKTLCDSARHRAYDYIKDHQELPRGDYGEVIPKLTKNQASEFISHMKGEGWDK